MNCLLCGSTVPAEAENCPQCGDHVRQWLEMNSLAEQFRGEGAFYAERGNGLRAALSFAKAAMFNPTDPATLTALGKLLARHADYEGAAYYLKKAIAVAEQQGLPATDGAQQAIERIEQLQSAPTASNNRLLGLRAIPRDRCGQTHLPQNAVQDPQVAAGQTDQASPPAEDATAIAWAAVTQVEAGGASTWQSLAEVLSWSELPADFRRGPWLYLRALAALGTNVGPAAEELFQQSAASDDSHRNADIYLAHLGAVRHSLAGTVAFLRQHGRTDPDIAETFAAVARIHTTSAPDVALGLLQAATALEIEENHARELANQIAVLRPRASVDGAPTPRDNASPSDQKGFPAQDASRGECP